MKGQDWQLVAWFTLYCAHFDSPAYWLFYFQERKIESNDQKFSLHSWYTQFELQCAKNLGEYIFCTLCFFTLSKVYLTITTPTLLNKINKTKAPVNVWQGRLQQKRWREFLFFKLFGLFCGFCNFLDTFHAGKLRIWKQIKLLWSLWIHQGFFGQMWPFLEPIF